jgi:site-specific recombinase XerC
LSEKLRGLGGALKESRITLAQYSEQWLDRISTGVKPRTFDSYSDNFRVHILPILAKVKVQKLRRPAVKEFLAAKLKEGLSGNTVRIINATLRACLAEAVEDGLILANPAVGLGKRLKLTRTKNGDVKAMDRDQLTAFLSNTDSLVLPLLPSSRPHGLTTWRGSCP